MSSTPLSTRILASLLITGLLGPVWVHADSCGPLQTYACYLENAKQCENPPPGQWNSSTTFNKWLTGCYGEYTEAGLKACREKTLAKPVASQSDASRTEILKGEAVTATRESPGWFQSISTARVIYQKSMNDYFACAVLISRIRQIESLETIMKKTTTSKEFSDKLKKEKTKYQQLIQKSYSCGEVSKDTKGDTIDRLMNSTMIEYCKYNHYLDYLESNINNDFSTAITLEGKLAKAGSWSYGSRTIIEAAKTMGGFIGEITNEKTRAKSTLPKAIAAYNEMNRTYTIHLLLGVIYEDYRTLRDQLDTYMRGVTQTFLKAHNAQAK